MGKYTILKSCNPCDDRVCAIPTKDIIFGGMLANMYDNNGQMWGVYGAGDYCIGGSQQFYDDVIEYIYECINFQTEDPIFYLNEEGKVFDSKNLTYNEIRRIEEIVQIFNKENEDHYYGDYITFWDGHKMQSYLLENENGIPNDFEIVEDSENIIEDFETAEFVKEKGGFKYYKGKLHLYSVSMWDGNPFSFQVETEY